MRLYTRLVTGAVRYRFITVVLGLLFLKYISDSFESRRDDLRAELTKDGIGQAAALGSFGRLHHARPARLDADRR